MSSLTEVTRVRTRSGDGKTLLTPFRYPSPCEPGRSDDSLLITSAGPRNGGRDMGKRSRAGLWANADFRKLWLGRTISEIGSRITRTGLPLTAVLVLAATPLQMGVLAAMGAVPVLLVGLFAGVWVDRRRRRPILIAADVGRAALLLTIPLAAWQGWLHMGQLLIVAALTG